MVNYTCDLCGSVCNDKTFALPIAATFIGEEPFDLIPVNMNLCRYCIAEVYKTIETLTTKEIIKNLNKLALDIKINKH